jgi:TRAP-type mannitol/chloroaromatic compound transport system permease small subunit
MGKFVGLCDRLSQYCGIFAGIMVLVGLGLVLIEIIIRTLFNMTLYIT